MENQNYRKTNYWILGGIIVMIILSLSLFTLSLFTRRPQSNSPQPVTQFEQTDIFILSKEDIKDQVIKEMITYLKAQDTVELKKITDMLKSKHDQP